MHKSLGKNYFELSNAQIPWNIVFSAPGGTSSLENVGLNAQIPWKM